MAGSYFSDIPGAMGRLTKYHFTQAGSDPARAVYYPTAQERAAAILAGYPDPGSKTYEDDEVYMDRRIKNPSNPQLGNLIGASNRAPTRCAGLQFFGEYLHAFEDTFGHRSYQNEPIKVNVGLGHLAYLHEPDKTYNGWGIDVVWPLVHYDTREARALEMEREVFDKMSGFKAAGGKSVSWAQLEPIMKEFNAIKEDDSTGFDEKIKLLNKELKQFGITRPDGTAIDFSDQKIDGYPSDGKAPQEAIDNRNKFLCTADGKRLNQADYPGTILPKGAAPCK